MSDPMIQNPSEDHSTPIAQPSIPASSIAPDPAPASMSDPVVQPTPNPSSTSSGFAWYVILALGLALFIRFFIAAPYVVSGSSMEPTFDNWDYLITDRLSYRFSEPERGDVIVFCLPGAGECSLVQRILTKEWTAPRTLIKRVIGLPGDTVSVEGNQVAISNVMYPDGFILDEPYLAQENLGGPTGTQVTLGTGEYFVMGDNRRVSSDSRVWGILPKSNIVGQVLIRLFPVSSLSLLPGDVDFPTAVSAKETP